MPGSDTGSNPFLRRAYDLHGPGEAEQLYDEWAETYDRDTAESMGYVGHEVAARRLGELVAAGATVLDAGCGTGLVGVEIARLGDYVLDGLDLSAAMLEKARATGVYRHLATADLTARTDVDDDAYDAVVCVGTLTEGHVGPGALGELVRVARRGGFVVATILDAIWEPKGYRDAVDALGAEGRARLLEADEHPYRTHQDVTCRLVVLEAR